MYVCIYKGSWQFFVCSLRVGRCLYLSVLYSLLFKILTYLMVFWHLSQPLLATLEVSVIAANSFILMLFDNAVVGKFPFISLSHWLITPWKLTFYFGWISFVLLWTGFVKFFGNLAIVDSPQQICERYPVFVEKVFEMAEGHDPTMIGVAVDTLGILGSNMEGKQVLQKTSLYHFFSYILIKLRGALWRETFNI